MRILAFFLLVSLGFVQIGCHQKTKFDSKYVTHTLWQHHEGSKVEGDFIVFSEKDSIYYLSNDTIFYMKIPKSIISSVDKDRNELIIKSVVDGQKGYYYDANNY